MENKSKIALLIIFAVLLADVVIYILRPLGEDFWKVIDTNNVVFTVSATIIGFYAVKVYGIKTTYGKGILFVTLGFMCQMLGDTVWTYQEVILGMEIPTFNPPTDIPYLALYPFFLVGLYFMQRAAGETLKEKRKFASLFVLKIILITAIIGVFGFYPNLINPDLSVPEKGVLLTYIIGNVATLAGMSVVMFKLLGKRFFGPWTVLLIGFAILTFADIIIYSWLANLYEVDNPGQILYDVSYITMAAGFYYMIKVYSSRDFADAPRERGPREIVNANLR